ncbi:MAG: SctK family type III secretion system sorting platform protein [Rhodospirillaceae bacterium]
MVEPDIWMRLSSCTRTEPTLSRFVLERFGLTDRFWTDFGPTWRRLALLSPEILHRVVLFAGLSLASAGFSRIVLGSEVRRLKGEIGEDGYNFAVKRAPFLVGDLAIIKPDTKAYDRRACERLGVSCLAAAFADEDAGLTRRLFLKLPKDLAETPDKQVSHLPRGRVAILLQKITTEVSPLCLPLFT